MASAVMDSARLSTLLGTCIVPAVLENAGLASQEGLDALYRSETFSLLSDPATALWHLSAPTLAEILLEELQGGGVVVPEERS